MLCNLASPLVLSRIPDVAEDASHIRPSLIISVCLDREWFAGPKPSAEFPRMAFEWLDTGPGGTVVGSKWSEGWAQRMRREMPMLLAVANAAAADAPTILHCHAGSSRSTAAALAVLVSRGGAGSEGASFKALARLRPNALPTGSILQAADGHLGSDLFPAWMRVQSRMKPSGTLGFSEAVQAVYGPASEA